MFVFFLNFKLKKKIFIFRTIFFHLVGGTAQAKRRPFEGRVKYCHNSKVPLKIEGAAD